MTMYQRKPIYRYIEAIQWTGDNLEEIIIFCGENNCRFIERPKSFYRVHSLLQIVVCQTLHEAFWGDVGMYNYISKDRDGDLNVVDKKIIDKVYERVDP